MYIKNGKIIMNEDSKNNDICKLQQGLNNFFQTDSRFSMDDISASVELEENWGETMRYELRIRITNYSKKQELGGIYKGETIDSFSHITYATHSLESQLVMNNNVPEFYLVFNCSSFSITNSETWQNNNDATTVEDIFFEELLPSICQVS